MIYLFIVSRPLTMHSGKVKAQIIVRDEANETIGLTKNFTMIIKASNYSGIGEDENYPDDLNIKNYFVKIDEKVNSFEELANLVQTKLDNGEFIGAQGPKGEKGDPGDVTEEYRNLAMQIAQNASDAQTSATNAQTSASNAQRILDDTRELANQTISEVNQIKTDTSALKDEAKASAVNAKASEDKAKEYANNLQSSTDNISKLKEDLTQMISYRQTEQEYNAKGSIIENWDSQGKGGYYDATGKWTQDDTYRWFRIDGVREEYSLYAKNLTGVCFVHVFSGEPSENTFVKRCSSIDSSLPTEGNVITIPRGYIVIVQNTDSSSVTIVCDNKEEYVFGGKLKEIEKIAKSSTETAEQALQVTNNTIEKVNMIAPPVDKTIEELITQDNCEFIGNYIVEASGSLGSNQSYYAYKFTLPYDGRWHMENLGNSSYGFLGVYHGEPNETNFDTTIGRKMGSDTSLWKFELSKGDSVVLSVNLISTIGFKMLYNYSFADYPTLFVRKMNLAWFGDSISQLQLLPHRVAEYMGIVVNDCSFAGAPLTYGAEAYQGTGFMSLSSQISNNDFTELERALSNQGDISEDKRGNADRLKGLNFNKITDIVVMAGTNDVNNDYVTTSKDLTKFKDGMRNAINTMQTAYPQINLYFVSNPYRGDVTIDKNGNSLSDFVNAEIEVCNELNIPYYDLYHNGGINANNIKYYLMSDKLHQNENGDILMAKKIAKWLMSN